MNQPYADAPVLCAVAAHGLPGSTLDLPSAPLDGDSWRVLLAGSRLQRLTGLLVRALEDGALPATPEQLDEAAELHLQVMAADLTLEGVLVEVAGLLTGAGIAFRVLKGAAGAHLDYPDPALRTFHDVDLLVQPEHVDEAVRVLGEAGFARRYPSPRPGFDARFGKAVTLQADQGAEIDLHRTFALGPFGQRIQVADLWSHPGTPFVLAGLPMTALDPDLRLLHAAYHAVLGDHPPRLVPLRDIAQLALGPGVSARRLLSVAASWQGEAVLAAGLRHAWATLGLADVTTLSAWADRYQTRTSDERDLAVYQSDTASFAGKSYAAVRGIPSFSGRLAYLRALLLPSSSYVRSRHPGRLARLARGTSVIFGRGGER